MQRIEHADAFYAAAGADIRHGGTHAYCAEGPDFVQMPPFETLRNAESYAAMLAHEVTHDGSSTTSVWVRDMGRVKWGDEGYAREELVAELGSAFLHAHLGITPEVRGDHVAYIATWLKVLKDDKSLIFSATSHEQRAADFLHGSQRQVTRGDDKVPPLRRSAGSVQRAGPSRRATGDSQQKRHCNPKIGTSLRHLRAKTAVCGQRGSSCANWKNVTSSSIKAGSDKVPRVGRRCAP